MTPRPHLFAPAGGDAAILLWDLNRVATTLKFEGHENDASCIRTAHDAPNSNAFATSSSDGTVRVWDMRTGKCTHLFDAGDECNACAWFPNGMALAAGCNNGKTHLFDLRSYGTLVKLPRPQDPQNPHPEPPNVANFSL